MVESPYYVQNYSTDFGRQVQDLKWIAESFLLQSIGASVGSSPLIALNWFIFY